MSNYIVVRVDEKSKLSICYDGTKPVIGNLKRAKSHADFLKSVNPQCEYRVASISFTKYIGTAERK